MKYLILLIGLVISHSCTADANWAKYLDCPDLEMKVVSKTLHLKVIDSKSFESQACAFVPNADDVCFNLTIGEQAKVPWTNLQELIVDVFNPGTKECRYETEGI